jgi:hypothetical protein
MSGQPEGIPGVDSSVPNLARMYDYYLGGSNNFEADRTAAEQMLRLAPALRTAAVDNRAFLGAAARWLAAQAGITQFLDIGTGLPANGAVHEVVPAARVVYVDYDPEVIAHAAALLYAGRLLDRVMVILGDLREPANLLADPELRRHLDLRRPVAVSLVAILHFIPDDYIPGIIGALHDALAPGSYVVISHIGGYTTRRVTADDDDASLRVFARARRPIFPRAQVEFTRLLDGFELINPAVVTPASIAAPEHDIATTEGITGWRLLAQRV